jgi:hypothetical protein
LIGIELENTDEKWVDFSEEDLKKIFSYFPNCGHEFDRWQNCNKNLLNFWKDCNDTKDPNHSLYISIYKINDEWWGVDENRDEFVKKSGAVINHHTFYRCDQFEGLIHLLDDKKYFLVGN